MRQPPVLLLIIFCFAAISVNAQPFQQTARDAFLINRMAEKFHVQPRALNDEFSRDLFDSFLASVDGQRIFYTSEDFDKLSVYRFKLDDEIKNNKTDFIQLAYRTFNTRLFQADSIIDIIAKTPFTFVNKESYTVSEDTTHPSGIAGMRIKIQKLIKLSIVTELVQSLNAETANASAQKALVDKQEPELRKRVCAQFKRSLKRYTRPGSDLSKTMADIYCQSIASCYDPHTAYFPKQVKDAFETSLGKKSSEYGLNVGEDEDGNVRIDDLKPGSNAFQSGQLNEGDKIQSVQSGNQKAQNVSDLDANTVNDIISNSADSKVTLTVKKADGSTRQVTIRKEIQQLEDEENKVKSFILKGAKQVGYISLPAFYSDWEDNRGINGCANDVAKEIVKLKKEGIDGLILDVRYNGGGSMQEAIELSGIFIDAGPVGQLKTRDGKIGSFKDVNRGTIYDGPLLVMVNGFSASASEMIAATLQDYNRALIVGSPTFGKATAQVILPLDTTIDINNYDGKKTADSYIKLTISALHRLNGSTAQLTGVQPHIVLPDFSHTSKEAEVYQKFALKVSPIEANKYYKAYPPFAIQPFQSFAKNEMNAPSYLDSVENYLSAWKKYDAPRDYSLNLSDAIAQNKNFQEPIPPQGLATNKVFTVSNHSYELQRLKSNKLLEEMNEEWKENLLTDSYIKTAFGLVLLMIK